MLGGAWLLVRPDVRSELCTRPCCPCIVLATTQVGNVGQCHLGSGVRGCLLVRGTVRYQDLLLELPYIHQTAASMRP